MFLIQNVPEGSRLKRNLFIIADQETAEDKEALLVVETEPMPEGDWHLRHVRVAGEDINIAVGKAAIEEMDVIDMLGVEFDLGGLYRYIERDKKEEEASADEYY